MTEDKSTKIEAFSGGEVLFAGGTDWGFIGRNLGGSKKKGDADADADRAEKFPNLLSPVRLKSLMDVKVQYIAAGSASCHCIIGDVEGRCYTWGRNEKGQLGHGDFLQRNIPTVVERLKDVKIISGAGGKHHTAVVSGDGESYTFGSNKEGQCGTGILKSNPKSEELLKSPVKALVSECTSVACGAEFTLWLCEGKLYSAGSPQYGQLGHGTDHEYNAKDSSVKIMYQAQPTPELIKGLAEKKIRVIACGHNHTLALDDANAAYTWGNGGYGRLGHKEQKDEFSPKQVDTLKGRMPVDTNSPVACGATSSFCTMIGEQLVSWGKLKASGDNTMYPKVVYELAGWKIRSITAGAYTFAAAASSDADQSTITWGQAQHGELGYGPKGKKSSANPDKCMALDGVYVHQVAMGIGYSMFLVDPEHPKVKELEVFEPVEAVTEPVNQPENDNGKGAAKGKGKAAGTKRKADAAATGARGKGKKA